MTTAKTTTNLMLKTYEKLNRAGLLQKTWVQNLFIHSYFTYKKYFEDPTISLTKNFPALFQNGHILDIGANIGYTSYVFSKVLTPSYQIFSFEPEENNLHIFKKAALKFQFINKINILPLAVGDKDGETRLWKNDGHHADHRILTDAFSQQLDNSASFQTINMTSIDSFLKNHSNDAVSFIKIDVQGYELPVCKGAEQTLLKNPNCVVLFEFCPSIMQQLGFKPYEIIHFFQEKNYFLYQVLRKGRLKLLNGEADIQTVLTQDRLDYFDILASRKKLIP